MEARINCTALLKVILRNSLFTLTNCNPTLTCTRLQYFHKPRPKARRGRTWLNFTYGGREVQRLTSVIRHPSSVIRHLVFSKCGHGCGLFACIRSCILELSNCISTSHETKWLAGLSLSKRAREVEANKKLAQGIGQFERL